jgi:hypothetical protein
MTAMGRHRRNEPSAAGPPEWRAGPSPRDFGASVCVLASRGGRHGRTWAAAFIAALLLASSALLWQAARATFTSTTSNPGNSFTSGTVAISDNDAGSAMFTANSLSPGGTATVCMGVTYTGSLTPSAIKLYTSGAQESTDGGSSWHAWVHNSAGDMDNNLTMVIQVSGNDLAADPVNSCAPEGVGTFTDVAAAAPGTNMETMINTYTNFATGLPSQWGTITANKWRVWKFTYTFSASAPNTAQNSGLKVDFVWEANS